MSELPYRIVVGLEVHVQLLTRTKLFCGCSTQFGLPPNSATCPVCIGLPGVLPVLNRRAFDLSLRAALALNCRIAGFTKWDRKNYYYPDLPKNYQISQYDLPFSSEGWLEINSTSGTKRIGIIRAHLEEDAGKMLHDESGRGQVSLVDLNRAGTPLLEIVSKPELSSPEEARIYLEEMRLLMRELGVSDCEMQEGSLRCDANVNIHIPPSPPNPLSHVGERGGQTSGSPLPCTQGALTGLGERSLSAEEGPRTPNPSPTEGRGEQEWIATPLVEIKNLNSFRFLERAVRYEAHRQFEEWQQNPGYVMGKVSKATAGWDEARGRTVFQRRKEEAADYRYFPEPDLVPVIVDEAWLERIRGEMGELPSAMLGRLVRQYGLSEYDSGVLIGQGRALVAYFEEVARVSGDAKAACNQVTNQVRTTLKETGGQISDFPITAARLGELIAKQKEMGLNKQTTGALYAHMLSSGGSAGEAISALRIEAAVADTGAVVEIVRRAMAANPKAVADFKKGKTAAANSIKGAIMRETKGSVRADVVEQVLREELEKA